VPGVDRVQQVRKRNEFIKDETVDDEGVDFIEQRLNVRAPFSVGNLSFQASN